MSKVKALITVFLIWLIENAYLIFVTILILLIACTFVISLETRETFLKSAIHSLGILMGDSYEKFNTATFHIRWETMILLVILRFLGWFITPIIVSILLDEGSEVIARTRRVTSMPSVLKRQNLAIELNEHTWAFIESTLKSRGVSETEINELKEKTLASLKKLTEPSPS